NRVARSDMANLLGSWVEGCGVCSSAGRRLSLDGQHPGQCVGEPVVRAGVVRAAPGDEPVRAYEYGAVLLDAVPAGPVAEGVVDVRAHPVQIEVDTEGLAGPGRRGSPGLA